MAEPPYGIICEQLKEGKVIPFLGAGASLSHRPPEIKEWNEKTAAFLPSGSELSLHLAHKASFPSFDPNDRGDLAKVSSYYAEAVANRIDLISAVHKLFDRDYQFGAIHRLLADIDVPLLIITTNYDDLIERAFKEKGKPYHLVTYPTERKEYLGSALWWKPGAPDPEPYVPSTLPLTLTDTTIIYKMHGTVDRAAKKWDGLVITEEDYIDFLARMSRDTPIPARFMLEFRKRRFLFLGYGLRDWNLRVMLRNMKTTLAKTAGVVGVGSAAEETLPAQDLSSWAIQRNPSELEQELWRARKVRIYDMDIETFVQKLRAEMTR